MAMMELRRYIKMLPIHAEDKDLLIKCAEAKLNAWNKVAGGDGLSFN